MPQKPPFPSCNQYFREWSKLARSLTMKIALDGVVIDIIAL